MNCPHCASLFTKEQIKRTILGYRTFRCAACKHLFNECTGTPFNYLEVPTDIVLLVVLWRLRYKLSLRYVAEMFLARGFLFTYETVQDWEARFAPLIADQLRTKRRDQAGTSWYADETYIKVQGKWCHLYRAIDTNHGYAKTAVTNSEVTKKREVLQKRLENVQRWTVGARKRMHNASKLYTKRCKLTKERATELYHILSNHQLELERQKVDRWQLRQTIKEEKAVADAEIEAYQQRQWKAYHTNNKEFAKCEKYCREQRELLRAIEDLAQQEREMYEQDNRKDQIMTVCKVALANVGMWVRDHYFSVEYAHTTWHRLQPFFQLPWHIFWGRDRVEVELKRFNDRALNWDLEELCAKVAQEQPRLPDGRSLLFRQGVSLFEDYISRLGESRMVQCGLEGCRILLDRRLGVVCLHQPDTR